MILAIVENHTAVKGISEEQKLGRCWRLDEKCKGFSWK